MPIPESECRAWPGLFAHEFAATPAPYYGVNIYDVNEENWDAFLEDVRRTHARIGENLGGRSHLWTVRDHGRRKRALWVNYFPKSIASIVTTEFVTSPEYVESWLNTCSLLEGYQWFCTPEGPSATP
jgi:hypothetical protein